MKLMCMAYIYNKNTKNSLLTSLQKILKVSDYKTQLFIITPSSTTLKLVNHQVLYISYNTILHCCVFYHKTYNLSVETLVYIVP